MTVSFPGFETRTVPDLRVRAGDNHRDVTLAIQKVDQAVSVGRDPAASASDPNGNRFNTVLSKEQIDALPDDPDEMERVLMDMAGPGATIRVDGFRGGRLPPKSQIRSLRFSRDLFAAENHFGQRPASGAMPGGPTMLIQRVGPGGAGDMLGMLGGGGAEDKRVRFELYVSAQNLFNHVNPIGFSGVMTSPFFGQPTAAMPGRRLDLGMRIGF